MRVVWQSVVACAFLVGCSTRIAENKKEPEPPREIPLDWACAVAYSTATTTTASYSNLPFRVQRCTYHLERNEDGSGIVTMALEGQEVSLASDGSTKTTPFSGSLELRLPSHEYDGALPLGNDESGTARAEFGASTPGTLTGSLSVRPEGEWPGFLASENFGVHVHVEFEFTDTVGTRKKTFAGGFVAGLAASASSLPCLSEDAKTPARGFICLGEGKACGGSITLPCCTDECQDNDGNPRSPTSAKLTCIGSVCRGPASKLPAYCAIPGKPTPGDCPEGKLYCGIAGTARCCDPSKPFFCATSGTCYSTATEARDACERSSNTCAHCRESPPAGSTTGDPCAPCASFITSTTSACAAPAEFSFGCYCTAAKMHNCMAKAPGCSTNVALSESEAKRMRDAANATGGGTCSF